MGIELGLFTPSKIPGLDGLVSIVISPTDLCNRVCEFCPHSKDFPNTNKFMKVHLAEMLASELNYLKWDGVISVSGYGEPLLHKDIGNIIKSFTSKNISTRLITNGDRILNGKVTPEEIDSWGLISIKIDCYDGEEDIKRMNEILKDLKTYKRISTGPTVISNRAGYLFEESVNLPCYQPFMKSIMDWNGEVYVCCEDWNRKETYGNVYNESFSSIWSSEKLDIIRKNLLKGNRSFSLTCKKCNLKPENTTNESESVRIWKVINNSTRLNITAL